MPGFSASVSPVDRTITVTVMRSLLLAALLLLPQLCLAQIYKTVDQYGT